MLSWACSISRSAPPSGRSSNVTSPKKPKRSPSVPAANRLASWGNWKSLWMTCFPLSSWVEDHRLAIFTFRAKGAPPGKSLG